MSWLKPSQLPPLVQLQDAITQWFGSELGQRLLEHEQRALDQLMPKLYGYHLLQVGVTHDVDLTRLSPAGHRFMLVPRLDLGMPETAVVGTVESLPIASECVDAVVLHHALDFAQSPHQALREAVRVLRPGGKLVVVGFNPHSFWGMCRLLKNGIKHKHPLTVPWLAHFMAHRRIYDWLTLLEMKPERVESGFFDLPLSGNRWMRRFKFYEERCSRLLGGAFWVVSASKESYAMTPTGSGWRRRFALPLATVQVPSPSGPRPRSTIARDYPVVDQRE